MKKSKKPVIVKETKAERLERVRLWRTTATKTIPNKKHLYNRQDYKKAVMF